MIILIYCYCGIFDQRKSCSLLSSAQKMKLSINDFFSKYDQIRSKLRNCSHLLKKALIGHLDFCTVF